MPTLPFSEALRERTWHDHGVTANATFMDDLLGGRGSREDYVAMTAQHYFIYDALESSEHLAEPDPIAAGFLTDKLTRLPSLIQDLEFLVGADWRSTIAPLPVTTEYTQRIHDVAASWPAGFIAHHYARYLGDLSGGQTILRAMRKRYGFDTEGVRFYLFPAIPDQTGFKDAYRDRLDAAQWTSEERERVVEEVLEAYRLNNQLFAELAEARATTAA